MIDTALDESANLHVLATPGRAQFLDTGNILTKAYAACALDAAGPVGGTPAARCSCPSRRASDIGSARCRAISHRQILKLALPALTTESGNRGDD